MGYLSDLLLVVLFLGTAMLNSAEILPYHDFSSPGTGSPAVIFSSEAPLRFNPIMRSSFSTDGQDHRGGKVTLDPGNANIIWPEANEDDGVKNPPTIFMDPAKGSDFTTTDCCDGSDESSSRPSGDRPERENGSNVQKGWNDGRSKGSIIRESVYGGRPNDYGEEETALPFVNYMNMQRKRDTRVRKRRSPTTPVDAFTCLVQADRHRAELSENLKTPKLSKGARMPDSGMGDVFLWHSSTDETTNCAMFIIMRLWQYLNILVISCLNLFCTSRPFVKHKKT
ncbi:unnamed protein product [Darwinula stevensoni]|uniref:Uncharacterized protein n=1 Tax=Darwinula stevensoni TaxID=69355 RepID=A0A7R8X2D2_9CRUS|nr:unnamed protein product [Darwinula stevensoni]CAG0883797.1 unnamed protein product [Darwinula stevensoni]